MGQNYPLNKRRGGGAWQWMLIGFVPGFLCAAVIAIVAVAGGFLGSFTEPQVVEVTREIQVGIVVTSTPDPLATEAVLIITATSEPTTEPVAGGIELATATVQVANTAAVVSTVEVQTSPTTDAALGAQPTAQTNVVSTGGFTLPSELVDKVSNLAAVSGGNFLLGTTNAEIIAAANECISRDGGQCDPNSGLDSTPPVSVTLDDFSIEQTEVTFRQYVAFLNYLKRQGLSHTAGCFNEICIQTANERPDAAVISYDGANYTIPTRLQGLENHPAYGVTWYGAQAYCQAIGLRLPTEAEWEYAARNGGQNIPYPWGTNWANDFANVRIPALNLTGQSTVEVTSFAGSRNGLGLYNMAGNVAEWTNDWYNESYYQTLESIANASADGAALNPQGPTTGTKRVARGGSFNTPPFFARNFHRQDVFPSPEGPAGDFPLWVGFRCAKTGLPDNTVPATTGTGALPLATIPVSGGNGANAQPVVPTNAPEESATEDGAARG